MVGNGWRLTGEDGWLVATVYLDEVERARAVRRARSAHIDRDKGVAAGHERVDVVEAAHRENVGGRRAEEEEEVVV